MELSAYQQSKVDIYGTPTTFHRVASGVPYLIQRQLDDIVNPTTLANATGLATSLGMGKDQGNNWMVIPIVVGTVVGLATIAGVLAGLARRYLAPKLLGDDDSEKDGPAPRPRQPTSSSQASPSLGSRLHGGLARILTFGRFPRVESSVIRTRAADVEQARPSLMRQVRYIPSAGTDTASRTPTPQHPQPLSSNPSAPATSSNKGKPTRFGSITRSNSLKRLSYGIRRVTDPIYNRSSYTPSHSDAMTSSSSSSSSSSSTSSAASEGSSAASADLCVFAASLPPPPGAGRHRRGRPVRSECGRETQLKLQQSVSSVESQAIADADDEASPLEERKPDLIPDMTPSAPKHRNIPHPKSILKRPTVLLGKLEIVGSGKGPEPVENPSAAGVSRSSSLRAKVGGLVEKKRSKPYQPRWAHNEEEAGEGSDDEEQFTEKPAPKKGVRFGQDTVRRISVLSTVIDEEEEWITVESTSESSLSSVCSDDDSIADEEEEAEEESSKLPSIARQDTHEDSSSDYDGEGRELKRFKPAQHVEKVDVVDGVIGVGQASVVSIQPVGFSHGKMVARTVLLSASNPVC